MESFQKTLELLQASHSIKYNIISNCTLHPIRNLVRFLMLGHQNTNGIKSGFEDFKSNFMEKLNL